MLPYWLGEVERVLADQSVPAAFGRQADDVLRIGVIGRDRTLPVGELYARIDAAIDRWTRRLQELDDRDLARLGIHPALGEMGVGEIIDRMLCGHLEDHVKQLLAILAPAPSTRAAG
jgi:hypothetical protein